MKETFILRTEWYSSLEDLSHEGKAQILDAIFLLHIDRENEISITDPMAKLCWNFMKPTIDYHTHKYWTSVENGKKGGRPKTQDKPNNNLKDKPNNKFKVKPNHNLTDTDTDTDTDIVIDSGTGTESVIDSVIDYGNLDFMDYEAQKLVDRYLKK
jgi:hypothetical protein